MLRIPAPENFRVKLETTKGAVIIELNRFWSPNGVDRFYNLVRNGYYNDSRFFRIRDKDFVQFGIHGRPDVAQAWRNQRIPDDPGDQKVIVVAPLRSPWVLKQMTEPRRYT